MQISLTFHESEEIFHNALCNGLSIFESYGLEVTCQQPHYVSAKERLRKKNPSEALCFEDVYLEILRGGDPLQVIDHDGDEAFNREIRINQIHEMVPKTPFKFLSDMILEQDDAETADVVLQTVFFGEIVFS